MQGCVAAIGRASSGIHKWVCGAGVLVFFVARMAVAGAWEGELGDVGWLVELECGQGVCLVDARSHKQRAIAWCMSYERTGLRRT